MRRCAPLLALLLAAGCSRPVSEWDRLERAVASARQSSNHPRAVELSRQFVTLARDHPLVDTSRLVRGYDLLQTSLMGAGIYSSALDYQQHLMGLMDGMQRPDSSLLRRLLVEAADCARRVGKADEAQGYLERAAALHSATGHADPDESARVIASLARTNALRGRFAAAESLQRVAIELRAASSDTSGLERSLLLASLARYVDERGRAPEAESLYTQALAMGARAFGEQHPMLAPLHLALGEFLHSHGRHADAVAHLERGVRLHAASPAYEATTEAVRLHQLAGSAGHVGDWEKARTAAERAIAIHDGLPPPEAPLPRAWVNDLAIIYVQLGRPAAAESLLTHYSEKAAAPGR